jgi:hypothetical protein
MSNGRARLRHSSNVDAVGQSNGNSVT